MNPSSPAFRVLDLVADAFDPALTLFAMAVPKLRGSWRGGLAATRYVLAALAGLAVVYGVQALDDRFGLWRVMALDYSTHTAYAASLATSIACWDRRWTWAMVVSVCGYAALILALGYHGPYDLLTAVAVTVPSTWALQRLVGPRGSEPRGPGPPS